MATTSWVAITGGIPGGVTMEGFRMIASWQWKIHKARVLARSLEEEARSKATDACIDPRALLTALRKQARARTGIAVGEMDPELDPPVSKGAMRLEPETYGRVTEAVR